MPTANTDKAAFAQADPPGTMSGNGFLSKKLQGNLQMVRNYLWLLS